MQRNRLTPQPLHGCLILLPLLLQQNHEPSVVFYMSSASLLLVKKSLTDTHVRDPILLSLSCKVFNLWYSNIFSNSNRPTLLKGDDPIASRTKGVNMKLVPSSKVTVSARWVLDQPTVFDVPSHDNTDTRLDKLTSLCLLTNKKHPEDLRDQEQI